MIPPFALSFCGILVSFSSLASKAAFWEVEIEIPCRTLDVYLLWDTLLRSPYRIRNPLDGS